MLNKLLLIISLFLFITACDNLSSRKKQTSVYDSTLDVDPPPSTITRITSNDALHFKSHTWNLVYYLTVDVYIDHRNSDISDVDVKSFLTGSNRGSVNTLLYQAGIVIDTVNKIERTKEPSNYGQSNNFIFNNNNKVNLQRNSDSADLGDGGTNFRIYVSNKKGGDGIASVSPRTHATRVSRNIGRNVTAHEIGHLFRLRHGNSIRAAPCSFVRGSEDLMQSSIFVYSLDITACEVLIMRSYAARLVSKGFSWIRTTSSSSINLSKLAKSITEMEFYDPSNQYRGRVFTATRNNIRMAGASTAPSPGLVGPPSQDDIIQLQESELSHECQN